MQKSKPWVSAKTFKIARTVHKWAGLTACLWLFVLGVTGIVLDHHEWRWVNQAWVPKTWSSDRMNTVIWPGTPMRYIAANAENPNQWIGASERGLWSTIDNGENWSKIPFEGYGTKSPQVHRIIGNEKGHFDDLILATDDGIWNLKGIDKEAQRLALKGDRVTAIAYGDRDGTLVGVEDKTKLFKIDIASKEIHSYQNKANVTGLTATEPFYRVAMDIHFGKGLLPGKWSIVLNDIGGIALAILALSGFFYWLLPKIWRRRKTPPKTRQFWSKWLFRGHGPIVGLVCLIPIFIVSLSAFPMNHIFGFISKTRDIQVDRQYLPPVYQAKSLAHEITGIVAWPNDNGKLSIGTRFGILHSIDNGVSWEVDESIPVSRGTSYANFFAMGDWAFSGMPGNNYAINMRDQTPEWEKLEGVSRAITGAAIAGDALYVKNSKAIFKGTVESLEKPFEETGIKFHHVAPGTPIFLFIADVHSGAVFKFPFKWINDLMVVMALLLVLSGPIAWSWRRWR